MKLSIIAYVLGLILIGFGFIVLSPIIVALADHDPRSALPFAVASLISVLLGLLCCSRRNNAASIDSLRRSEGLCIVSLTWILTAVIAGIPYLFFGISPLDAYFESVSGITTTGATILTDFSLYPKTFFFWRSLTQWLGGMGIIVLVIAILPQFSVAGRKLFFAEAPGPTEEKITPRVTNTAKALWIVYVALTALETALLTLAGMPFFDALCNSLTTLAAGGFSPNPESIMGYGNPTFTWIITVFMFLAGSNFALQYTMMVKGRPGPLFKSEEFRLYVSIILVLSVALSVFLFFSHHADFLSAVRESLFQVISVLTTTGFASSDFALWLVPAQTVLVIVMFAGGCAGSAGGGIKVVRILFIIKYLRCEMVKILHPQSIVTIKLDRSTVTESIQRQMLGFLLLYLATMGISGVALTLIEGNATIGLTGTAATLGNIGPGFGEIGPMASFGLLHPATKMIMIFNMIAGRLELIPVLIMLHPDYWHFRK